MKTSGRLIAAVVATISTCDMSSKYIFHGRLPNWCDSDYGKIMDKIIKTTEQKHALFTRM
jgi:hypothetical protein